MTTDAINEVEEERERDRKGEEMQERCRGAVARFSISKVREEVVRAA